MSTGKAVTRGVFGVFEHPPKFQGKIRHTKTDLLLVIKFSKVTTGYPRYTHFHGYNLQKYLYVVICIFLLVSRSVPATAW